MRGRGIQTRKKGKVQARMVRMGIRRMWKGGDNKKEQKESRKERIEEGKTGGSTTGKDEQDVERQGGIRMVSRRWG